MFTFSELELCLMTDLKVISKIRDNERILTKAKSIAIDSNDRLQFIRRWMKGENRADNIQRVVSVFNRAFDIVNKETNESRRRYFVDEIRKARKGVSSIQITYRGDSHIDSCLDLLIDRIDKIVSYYTPVSFC